MSEEKMLFFCGISVKFARNFQFEHGPLTDDEVSGAHSGLFYDLFSLLFGELRVDVARGAGHFHTAEDH